MAIFLLSSVAGPSRTLLGKVAACGVGWFAVVLQPSPAASAQYQYLYDQAGRLVAMSAAGLGATTYAYDASGNLLQRSFSTLADADGDGLVAAQETALGLDPADADSDDDGANDGAEVTAGTNPLNPGSRFDFLGVTTAPDGAVEITVPSVMGRQYTLQTSSTLGVWVDEPGAVAVAGTGAALTLRDAAPGPGRNFYRVLVTQ
jgi:hypothetical protein